MEWVSDWQQIYDYRDLTLHVTILGPKAMGNKRQIVQQSPYYTFTNVTDIADHIVHYGGKKSKIYLKKYDLSVKERTSVMIELEAMGITAYSLFGNTEALCRYYKEIVFRSDQVGKTPSERMADFLKSFPNSKK